ncbi:MAG: hypothetical protein GY864_14880 [Desulfobacterales bacterium]|nr:hypothetical protein [Desulfobacterales bacterium]
MTVRFSDIIGKGQKNGQKASSSQENTHIEKAQATNPQALNTSGIEDTSAPFSSGLNNKNVKTHYKALLEKATDIRDRVKTNKGLSHAAVLSILRDVVNDELVDQLYEYAISVPDENGLQAHTVCVTLGSMKIGLGMGYDKKNLLRLGLAAFLENVGMYKIPEQILGKKGKLGQGEMNTVMKHPRIGGQILGRMGAAFQWLIETALQVHERSDGSGYPSGSGEEDIDEAASIIGIMDTYVAMIKNRPYRDKIPQTDAVKAIIKESKQKFPIRVLKEFLNQISLFPVNTYVKLNNKSIGRVISVHKNQPLRPVIELLYDGLGKEKEESETISLSESPLLHIVGTIQR